MSSVSNHSGGNQIELKGIREPYEAPQKILNEIAATCAPGTFVPIAGDRHNESQIALSTVTVDPGDGIQRRAVFTARGIYLVETGELEITTQLADSLLEGFANYYNFAYINTLQTVLLNDGKSRKASDALILNPLDEGETSMRAMREELARKAPLNETSLKPRGIQYAEMVNAAAVEKKLNPPFEIIPVQIGANIEKSLIAVSNRGARVGEEESTPHFGQAIIGNYTRKPTFGEDFEVVRNVIVTQEGNLVEVMTLQRKDLECRLPYTNERKLQELMILIKQSVDKQTSIFKTLFTATLPCIVRQLDQKVDASAIRAVMKESSNVETKSESTQLDLSQEAIASLFE